MSPNKKVTKEIGIGEALNAALPRVKDALSYVPHPSRTSQHRWSLTYILFHQKVFRLFDGSLLPRKGGGSEANANVNTGFLKLLQLRSEEVPKCATGVSKGGVFGARERDSQRPFGRILLVLFLAEQEKYMRPPKNPGAEKHRDFS